MIGHLGRIAQVEPPSATAGAALCANYRGGVSIGDRPLADATATRTEAFLREAGRRAPRRRAIAGRGAMP
jgi:hypothetical protein